jgi:DNA-binding LacI/PurR family transcriptional regulator
MGKPMPRTTITDVARLANVSTSSVSNVLNGRSKRMRPDTRERIQHAIKELGYTPNLAARQLKTGHAAMIGLIVPSLANPFFGYFARLVEEFSLKHGYQVLIGNSDRDQDREQLYAEALWGNGVRGIIFGTSLADFSHLEKLIAKGMHVVAFDRPTQQSDRFVIDSVGVDNVMASRLITKHLLALGHRRIGFISGPIQTVSRIDRLEGYQKSLREAKIPLDQELIWEGSINNFGDTATVELGRQGTHELLSKVNPPTAIMAINDMYAFGVYAGARDLGVRIPEDLSVTGIDDTILTEVVEPSLTTARQPIREIAHLAVERLINRLRGNCIEPPGHQALLPNLIVRASTARCSDK